MELIAGLITAAAVVGLGCATRQGRSLAFYNNVLIVIALAYVLFAVMAGAPTTIVVEGAIASAFVALAVVVAWWPNLRTAGLLVTAGLAAHGAYDLVHHAAVSNPVVPEWWPVYCGVVDVLLAGWVVHLGRGDGPQVQSGA